MGFGFKAPWRSNAQYQSLDALYIEKESIRWYWRLIAQIAIYMILGGFLILPTTFNSDPQLRFNKGVLAIIIVALLTGGYSLTGLVWFACPSTLFRLDSIFIPVFSVSIFAFCATCYALAASPRYVFHHPAAPTALALTVGSALLYGVFALISYRLVKRSARPQEQVVHHRDSTQTTPGLWQEQGYYQNYVQNTYPAARSPNTSYEPYGRGLNSFDGNSTVIVQQPSEEELVNQQMAKLLTRENAWLSPNASKSTFRLEWPQGEENEPELDANGQRRQPTFDDSGRLLAPQQGKKRSQSVGNTTWGKISKAVGADKGAKSHQRARSRDDRRREIELNNFSQTLPTK